MDPTTATHVWIGALALGGVVWLLGWRSYRATFGDLARRPARGQADVPGGAGEVSQKLARALANAQFPLSARVERASDVEVRASVRVAIQTSRRAGPTLTRNAAPLLCRFEGGYDRTRVVWELDVSPLAASFRFWAGAVLLLGLVAIAVVAWVMPSLVIPHENPAVRGQVFQSLQMIHFLWPPFLLTAFARRARILASERVADVIQNLPYV